MSRIAMLAVLVTFSTPGLAQSQPPVPTEGDWIARDFRFHTGKTFAELRVHYVTLGRPGNPAVIVLHGTGQSGTNMLSPSFAGELFGPGQPLDANRYFIIIPDAIGHGGSAKPSDGLRARFPKYNYDDMVEAQYRLAKEGFGLTHVRVVLGNQWAACTRGCGEKLIHHSWTDLSRSRPSQRPWVDATG